MKKILIVLILVGVLYYLYHYKKEYLTADTLRNPAHLPATVRRVTNTILTAPSVFSDKMDGLTLPAAVKDNFNEWIDKGFVSIIKDQMLCGGCWAFATCGSLADRLSIATNGQWYAPFGLSEQILISCGGDMGMEFYQGCEGGIPHAAIDALSKEGVPADSMCLDCGGRPGDAPTTGDGDGSSKSGVVNPNDTSTCSSGGSIYSATNYTWWQTGCNSNTSCSLSAASTCPCTEVNNQLESAQAKDTPFTVKYKTTGEAHGYTSHGDNDEIETVDLWPGISDTMKAKNVDRMKKAIYYEGPITVGYKVMQDFYTFWPTSSADDYYKYDNRSQMAGGHAVVIVGWKKMADGTPVWIVKNSWGENAGYGFPDGPKWKDPVTGKTVPKYIGGFWNHIMGINDSFIESNATGAHPDLQVPQISAFLNNVPVDWHDTITLRDIYEQTSKKPVKPAKTTPLPLPDGTPTPEYVPVKVESDEFKVITLTPENITMDSVYKFFGEPKGMYMIGANDVETIEAILDMLPSDKTLLTQLDIKNIAEQVKATIKGYIIIAARGSMNNYYYIYGDPVYWNIFTKDYAHRAATLKKFVNDIYRKFLSLRLQAPIVQASSMM